jgi:serine/threonine-protein kinase
MVAPGAVLAGKYRVERILGEGGMGVVVAAHHTALQQQVALKLLRGAALGRPDATERFLREARNAVRLRSQHVARVFDVGTLENGWPYIVMEYLEGADLDQVVRVKGPLPPARAVGHVLQACEAVAEAHALGIVHRDLKPHNLFLTTGFGGLDLIKVLDFGISKSTAAVEGVLTQTNSSVGSPLYMSPEQMRTPRAVDFRTDIWSLGVTLYEIIAGRPPFDAETYPELVLRVTEGPIAPLATVRTDVPRGISALIMKCLERDPNQRFADIADLATALEPFAAPDSRPAAENARRALGRSPSARNIPVSSSEASVPFPLVNERSPNTVDEATVDTVRGPDTVISGTENTVKSAQPPAKDALVGSGASAAQAWSGSLSASSPVVPLEKSRLPWIAFAFGVGVMIAVGAGVFMKMRARQGEEVTPAASLVPAASISAPIPIATLSVAAIATDTPPIASASASGVPTAITTPIAPAASARPRRHRTPPTSGPTPGAGKPPVDEIPSER